MIILIQNCNQNQKLNADYKFEKIKVTDSTSFIQWTDGKIIFQSSKPIDNNYLDEKTHLIWNTKKYLCFRHSNGSDTWTDLILPLTINEVKIFENPLSYDKENGIVVYESDSAKYKLIAENIDFGKKEFIGKDWVDCSSVFPHYCIDSINVKNKELYIKWTLPNKIEIKNRKEIKKLKLNL